MSFEKLAYILYREGYEQSPSVRLARKSVILVVTKFVVSLRRL